VGQSCGQHHLNGEGIEIYHLVSGPTIIRSLKVHDPPHWSRTTVGGFSPSGDRSAGPCPNPAGCHCLSSSTLRSSRPLASGASLESNTMWCSARVRPSSSYWPSEAGRSTPPLSSASIWTGASRSRPLGGGSTPCAKRLPYTTEQWVKMYQITSLHTFIMVKYCNDVMIK